MMKTIQLLVVCCVCLYLTQGKITSTLDLQWKLKHQPHLSGLYIRDLLKDISGLKLQ